MKCREVADFLMAYLDGELPEDQRGVFEAHLRGCSACERYLESYRRTVELGRKAYEGAGGCGDLPGGCPGMDADATGVPEEVRRAIRKAMGRE